MKWYWITAILCLYGFFKEFRPIEPFLNPYLVSPVKNFTSEQLYSSVYPFSTYSCLVVLIPTFLLTDLLRYKAVICFESITYAATWILLIWGRSIGSMQLMQTFYGCATATEIAYYAYIFAAVDSVHYRRAISYVKAAVEIGDFFAYALSQLLISTGWSDLQTLNYISLASCILILLIAASLPGISYKKSTQKILDTEKNASDRADVISDTAPRTYMQFVRSYFLTLWSNFRGIYSSAFMWKWSLWWALATCGYMQIGNYIQPLWAVVQKDDGDVLNGAVEAVNTLLAALAVVCIQFVRIRWNIWGELALAVSSALACAFLIIISQSDIIYLIYVLYIIFNVIYHVMYTIAMYNIAKRLTTESYGLVFGFNTFIALALETVLTLAVADSSGLAFDIRTQFVAYGCYYGLIALIFMFTGAFTWYQRVKNATHAYDVGAKYGSTGGYHT